MPCLYFRCGCKFLKHFHNVLYSKKENIQNKPWWSGGTSQYCRSNYEFESRSDSFLWKQNYWESKHMQFTRKVNGLIIFFIHVAKPERQVNCATPQLVECMHYSVSLSKKTPTGIVDKSGRLTKLFVLYQTKTICLYITKDHLAMVFLLHADNLFEPSFDSIYDEW